MRLFLSNSLSITERFPELESNSEISSVTLNFIYRMPWIFRLSLDTKEGEISLISNVSIEENLEINQQFTLIGNFIRPSN